MGYIEAWGLGIDMMNQEMQAVGLPRPDYRDTGNSFIVTLWGPGEGWMIEGQKPNWYPSLNQRQRKAIDYIEAQGQMTNREYQSLCQVSQDMAHRDLLDLVNKEILKREGKGRSTHYLTII